MRVRQSKVIRVMVVEDHPLLIEGLRRVLESEDDLVIVAEATTGDDAIRLAIDLVPDVILMDVNLHGKNGIQATHEIKQTYSLDETSIVILTAYNNDEPMLLAFRSGASAYYPKDVQPSDLIPAIRLVTENRYIIHNQVMNKTEAYRWLLTEMEKLTVMAESTPEVFMPLSPREMQVLELTTKGASNKEIASMLVISRQTVKNHMSSILRKLGVEDRTQAAVLALRRGWVRTDGNTLS
jgi:DNA-binding NarL/FixJ family response regulator